MFALFLMGIVALAIFAIAFAIEHNLAKQEEAIFNTDPKGLRRMRDEL